MLFSFNPFHIEEYLELPPVTGIYFEKLQEPGVLDVINRNRAEMEPFSDVVDEALLNLQSNLEAFPQQESDENQEQIALIVNDLLDNENLSDRAVLLEDTPFIGHYSTPTLISDDELSCKIRSLNYEQCKLFDIIQDWAKHYVKSKSFSLLTVVEPLHILLAGGECCGKSFLMKVMYQSLIKIFSYGNVSLDKRKVLLMAPIGVAAINNDGTTIPTALNIPVGHFGKNVPSLNDKMRSTLSNRLSDLKVIIIDETSMESNNLLYFIHLQLNEIFGTKDIEPFAGLAVGDFFQLPSAG